METLYEMADPSRMPLPKFSAPPVIETVLGVEFDRLENWGVPHFGLYWSTIKDRFPRCVVKPPISTQIEVFEKPKLPVMVPVRQATEPEIRCWFIDGDDRALIQVQGNRFTYNWRKMGEGDSYPHYDEGIRPAFSRELKNFLAFVREQQLGEVNVVQCEVSYINHIEVGQGWDAPDDLHKVFPCWSGRSMGEFLPPPENVSFDVSYRFPENRGRLRVSVRPAIRHKDGREILQLTLTARGRPIGDTETSWAKWIDLGREWVVRGFADFTASAMHAQWNRKS
jgi:uncharacterized protein (TIGR04255 family)